MSNKNKIELVVAKFKELLNKVGVTDEHLNDGVSFLKNAKNNARSAIREKAKKPMSKGRLITLLVVGFLVFKTVIAPIFAPKKVTYEKVYTVLTNKVELGSLQEYFRVNGDVLANNAMNILPDAGGKLVRYTVIVGQQVRKGQIVAYVDPSKPGFVFELSPVRAPMAGTITRLPLELGNTVSTSDSVAQMGEIEQLKVETYIPERLMANVKIGTKAKVEVIAYPGVFYDAEIEEVAPVLDPATRTAYVKLFIPNIDDKIKAGMFAGLKILTISHTNTLVVPISALITRNGKQYLAVINRPMEEVMKGVSKTAKTPEGTRVNFDFDYDVRIVPVELGGRADGNTVVLSGIKEGDVIVTNGQSMLLEGSKVKIISEANIGVEVVVEDKKPSVDKVEPEGRFKVLVKNMKNRLNKLMGKDASDETKKTGDNVPILLPPAEKKDDMANATTKGGSIENKELSSESLATNTENSVVKSSTPVPVASKPVPAASKPVPVASKPVPSRATVTPTKKADPAPVVSATPAVQTNTTSPVVVDNNTNQAATSSPDVSQMGSDDL